MLLEEITSKQRDNAMMEKAQLSTSSTNSWPAGGVIKPVPERPEPVYPSALIRDSLKAPESLRVSTDLRHFMGLPAAAVPQTSSMYPFLQFPLPGNSKYLPFGSFMFHAKYPLGKKTFHCPQCRYVTDRKNNLKRHISTMHQDCGKPLECCEIHFKSKAALRDHVMMFHRAGYKCRFCGRNFCRKALLKRHLAVHNGQKDFICSVCDYATSHKSNLERHKKVHGQGTYSDDDDLDDSDGQIDVEGMEHSHPYHSLPSHALQSIPHSFQSLPHSLQLLRSQYHHQLLDMAAANSQSATMHPNKRSLFNSHSVYKDRPEDLSPGISDRQTPEGSHHSPRARPKEETGYSRASSSRSLSPGERPSTPPEVNADRTAADRDDVTHLYRYDPKRLFGSPYKCNDCTLSFASQMQLALHSRDCKSSTSPVTSSASSHVSHLPLPITWPPYPFMLPSNPLNMPLMSGLPLSGLNPNLSFNPYKPRSIDSTSPLKPTFWPFTLQAPRDMTSHLTSQRLAAEIKDDVNLPPKKRQLAGSEPGALDCRTSTLAAGPAQ